MTLTLEGDTLGEKHRHYNKLVADALTNKQYELSQINSEYSDVDNLLKIDIACKTRNVAYILEVLKSDDMLYVSRAIKMSSWLITDQQYAGIINPEYLHTQLFPSMNTKAINKLMLSIRLHLRDATRVEAFYEHLKGTDEACRWLLNCSEPFIKNVIQNERYIPLYLFKRLCKKSITYLTFYQRVDKRHYETFQESLFLLKSHTDEFLDVLEKENYWNIRKMSKKHTEILMANCPQRILDKLDVYIGYIDMSVLAKHLKTTDIQGFLREQAKNQTVKRHLNQFDNLKHFVKYIPKDERYEFIKKTFIEKPPHDDIAMFCSYTGDNILSCGVDSYYWYQFAPYNEAFTNLIKLIRSESSPQERCTMLSILVTCAKKNPEHIKSLIQFYYKKHINEPFKFKVQFINNLLTQIATHELDDETWSVLDQIFHSMEVYIESDNNVQMCLKSIIIYKVIHDMKVPEIVERKFVFDSLKKSQRKLNHEQKEKLFTYLLNSVSAKLQNQTIVNESDFNSTICHINNALTFLMDWKKDINDYSFLLNKIQELIRIKENNSWKIEISDLYNMKKSWRKSMFDESLTLCPNEEVCLNALKHKPQLLMQHDLEMEKLRINDAVTLRRLLAKLRVYWPQTIAKHWIDAYLLNLNKPTGQKAVINGLFRLLPQKELIDMAKKHVPEDPKIKWGETDQTEISLRKNIAKYLHVARPLVPLDTVLWYAKGDYLQYAVPSLNSMLHCINKTQSREYLQKLLEAPVSLQKFGLRFAFEKLKSDELKPIFLKVWKSTKNTSIRAVLFTHTYNLICNVKNETVERELWELLCLFIDNLSAEENKEIYIKLNKPADVPVSIKAEFFMKAYNFLTTLPEKTNCESYINNLLYYAPNIIESLDEDFVVEKILAPAETKFSSAETKVIDILATFVLCSKNQEVQLRRYKRALVPAMEDAFKSWDKVSDEEYYIKKNFNKLIKSLIWNFRKLITMNRCTPPANLFTEIKNLMENNIALDKNFVLYTSWKFAVEYVNIIDQTKCILGVFESGEYSQAEISNGWMSDDIESIWREIHNQVSPVFGRTILKHLKQDSDQHIVTTWWLYSEAINKTFEDLSFQRNFFKLETLKYMLDDEACISSYLVVCSEIPKYCDEEVKKNRSALREKIRSHPSKEVQIFYYRHFEDIPEDTV